MASRSPSRGRNRSLTRSPTPTSPNHDQQGRRRRYDSRSPSRSPLPPPPPPSGPRRNGRARSDSRSRSRSRGRGGRDSREPSAGPAPLGTKIVVERLSKNVREAHLREIFGFYGPIQDLDLPINRTFGTNRGTAYILFEHREDAEEAIANMHEGQIDGATINVSIVLPRRIFSPEPPLARRGANIDPRNQVGGSRGGRGGGGGGGGGGGRGFPSGPGFYGEGRGGRRRPPSSPGRFGPRQPGYPPSERSRSRSPMRSPPRGPRGRGGDFKPRSYSRDSRSISRSRSPPPRRGGAGAGGGGGGGGSRYDDASRRRSRSRSFDSYAARNRSISPRREYR